MTCAAMPAARHEDHFTRNPIPQQRLASDPALCDDTAILAENATAGFTALRRPELLSECRGFSAVFARILCVDSNAREVSRPHVSGKSPMKPRRSFRTLFSSLLMLLLASDILYKGVNLVSSPETETTPQWKTPSLFRVRLSELTGLTRYSEGKKMERSLARSGFLLAL
jgi:hypothetical protein